MYSTLVSSTLNLPPTLLPSPAPCSSWGLGKSRPLSSLPLRTQRRTEKNPGFETALSRSGLRTPPAEDMGTTYQVPNLASYDTHHTHHHSAFASTLSQNDRGRAAASAATHDSFPSRTSSQSQIQIPPHQAQLQRPSATQVPRQSSNPSSEASQSSGSRHSTRHSTPTASNTMAGHGEKGLSERDATMVLHSLHIPRCIDPKGGNLADFAAQITALFWFESIKVLEAAEKVDRLAPTATIPRLNVSGTACPSFKKWVHTVLSTTQVTQNVILLALLFIYRLKIANPGVNGRSGSEYRLLTVALMLGNKFLDDNTYTNKTWADVSGIDVKEIHVMEVEFLSNMRYSLLVSKDAWEEWLVKLAKFWEYIDRASRPAATPSPLQIPSPTHRTYVSPLPSPTGSGFAGHITPSLQSNASSSTVRAYSPVAVTYGNSQPMWPTAQPVHAMNSAVSPLAMKPEWNVPKKRSFPEEDPTDAPVKRPNLGRQSNAMVNPQSQPPMLSQAVPQQVIQHQPVPRHPIQHQLVAQHVRPPPAAKPVPSQARLSVPNLTINTSQAPAAPPVVNFTAPNYAPQQTSALSLPPLVPGVRAMATVYPATTFPPQLPVLPTAGPSMSSANNLAVTPTTTYPPMPYGTPTKRLSPQHALTPLAAYASPSPISDVFSHHTPIGTGGHASGVHTPIAHSPSIYLQQRPSPYKPVRHVNTLLIPPPSAALHQYHLTNSVPPAQMHYQPLGRRHDVRTGIVPEFMIANAGQYGGPPGGHHHALTPVKPPPQPMQRLIPGVQAQEHGHPQQQYGLGLGRHSFSHHPPN